MTEKQREKTVIGTVTEALPNALFRVQPKGENSEIIAYLSGKMRLNRIKVLIGDMVEMVIDPYGGRARIVHRIDNRQPQL